MFAPVARFAKSLFRALPGSRFNRELLDSVPIALAMRDADGNYLFVNARWEAYFGGKRAEVVGRNVRDRASAEVADHLLALDRAVIEGGAGATMVENDFEYRGRRYTQTRSVMTDAQGRVVGVLVASIDTTERHEQEQRLRDQMALTAAIVDQQPNAVFTKDAEGRFTMVNRAWTEMSGYSAAQALGRTVHDIYPPSPAKAFAEEDAKLIAQGATAPRIESLHRGPRAGQWRIVRKAVLCRDDGTVQGLVCTSTDISELKRYEAELAERAKFTSDLLDELPVSMALRDTEGRFERVNRAWERYFNLKREEVIGRRFDELPGWRDDPELSRVAREASAYDREALAAGPERPAEPLEQRRRGRTYLISRRAFADTSGRIQGVLATGVDITEQRATEQALELERERLDLLVRSTKSGFSDWDAATDTITYSGRLKEMLGQAPDADASAWPPFYDLIHPDDRAAARERFRVLIAGLAAPGWQDAGEALEYRLRRADGSYVWVHAEGMGYVGDDGRTQRFIASFSDITRFREQERELRDQMLLARTLIDANPNAMYLKDVEGRYVTVNDAWLKMIGVTAGQAIGRRIDEMFSDAEHERYHAEDVRLLTQGHGSSEVESLRTGPDGRPQWLIVRKAVLRRADGEVIGLVGTNTNITRLKQYETELAAERQRLDLVVRATQAGIVDWDIATETPWYSARFKEMLGYPPDHDTAGWNSLFGGMMHPQDRDRSREIFLTGLVDRGEPNSMSVQQPYEMRLARADGSWLWVENMGLTLRDETGEAKRYLAAITDITERRAHEEELRASVRMREEVERMSRHDLKTPLASVIAVSRLMRESSRISAEDAELLGTIERAGYRILNMVNLSLDLFRMESGTYQFRPQAVDLDVVAAKVASDLAGQAASKNVNIAIERRQPAVAHAEELLCYSMFANLVKNAIEAAPEGSSVRVVFDRDGDDVLAHVRNLGRVPEGVRERFFQKYATAGKSAGLGLGSYSARLMARTQEGDLLLSRSDTEGTTLTVRLRASNEAATPILRGDLELEKAATPPALPPLGVLVVDDDEFNRLVLRRYLPPPLQVALAVNGRAALDAAARDWPDVVLLDLEMPVMDGYETARALRDIERSAGLKRLRIVAISSNDEQAIIDRALAAGCDRYLVKPAPRETLWELLRDAAAGMTQAQREESPGPDDPVLVDPDLRDALPEFLVSRAELLEQMPDALVAGERVRFKGLAHRLAGSFGLYGFRWASRECHALEQEAVTGDTSDLGRRVAAVRDHLARFAATISA